MRIADCLARAGELAAVSDSPRLDVELLLADCLGRDRTYLFTWPERELTAEQVQAFKAAFDRRAQGEPVAHILGEREFWSLPLQVNASTLIPRPDTELLVELALQLLPPVSQRVLDLGTGTGAIALALASERPAWHITAVDRAPEAVQLAEHNRKLLGYHNVYTAVSDWFSTVDPVAFDLIISNPPYIDVRDPHLQLGDVRFEPASALVSDGQGLADIQLIVERAAALNHKPFWLLLEHGWQQGEPVRQLMTEAGYIDVVTHRDLGGRERATLGRITKGR